MIDPNILQQQLDIFEKKLSSDDSSSELELYHYTNADSGLNILRTKELWFTNYLHLDDNDELRVSANIIKNLENIFSGNERFLRLKKLYFKLRKKLRAYTISFCEDKTNAHLWNKYAAQKTGCTINSLLSSLEFDIDYPIVHMKIIYDIRETEFFRLSISEILTFYLQIPLSSKQTEKELWTNIFPKIFTFMLAHAPRFKQAQFAKEKEYRLYIMDSQKNIPRQLIVLLEGKERCILKLTSNSRINTTPGENCKLKQELLNEVY